MKKWILVALVFSVVVIGAAYFIVAGRVHLQQGTGISVNANAFSRTFVDEKRWTAWWPGKRVNKAGKGYASFGYNGNTYTVVEKRQTSFIISICHNRDSFNTELFFIPLNPDSVLLNWEGTITSSVTAMNRVQLYYLTKNLNNDIKTILQHIQHFYSKQENIYGRQLKKEFVLDSTLISTSTISKGYPSTQIIYRLVNNLSHYAEKNSAAQTGYPMLNIYTEDSVTYAIKVALPVDKKLKDSGNISYRWMLGGGRILVTEVDGGPYAIENAFAEMEHYISDFHRTAPAIPFQSLITDRSKEPDTSKWVTKLYWPVM